MFMYVKIEPVGKDYAYTWEDNPCVSVKAPSLIEAGKAFRHALMTHFNDLKNARQPIAIKLTKRGWQRNKVMLNEHTLNQIILHNRMMALGISSVGVAVRCSKTAEDVEKLLDFTNIVQTNRLMSHVLTSMCLEYVDASSGVIDENRIRSEWIIVNN